MNSKQQGHFQKSALADKKFNELKLTRKTSFLVPPSPESEDEDKESSDYISDFPDYKRTNKALIDLKKRKLSQGAANKLSESQLQNDTTTAAMQNQLNSNLKHRENSSDEIYKLSKFRPTTPKVFNYFPVSINDTSNSSTDNHKSKRSFILNNSMNSIDFAHSGNKIATSNSQQKVAFNQRLPKINPAIKENLLSSRSTTKEQNKSNEKLHKNLFFPLLINNSKGKKTENIVSALTNYLDDPSGVFFLQSLSHLSMKNLNQT